MKVLAVCQGGNVRSVSLAFLLKYRYGIDALACSFEKNSPETISMLCSWADSIVVMEPQFSQYIPEMFQNKIQVCNVGPDVWGNPLDPRLLELIENLQIGRTPK
jgi:predicted protein tyrosine phosphatase